jgi:hypothetical protein
MNTDKIRSLLRKRCGKRFLGVFPIDRLPNRLPPYRPLLLVCNTDKHDKEGEHWVVLFIDTKGEFFDSLGEPPARTFETYLNRYCNSFETNERQLQSITSYFCGHYAVYYCLMKCLDYSLSDIVRSFTPDTGLNDFIVHKFVCDHL